jgi:hypothetical protein
MVRFTAAVVLASLLAPVFSYERFVALLPNGNGVSGVQALGHVKVGGDGALNAFGEDFEQSWTKELCEADSDGDGQTNGQELGDPCCVWDAKTASTPRWTTGVSHPGDATSKSDEALLTAVKCSNATASSTSSSASGSAGVSMSSTSMSSSGSAGVSTSSTSGARTGAVVSTAAGFVSLILALVA